MKPTLLFVRSSAHVGGVERYLLSLARHMTRRGWGVILAFLYRQAGAAEHPAAAAARAGGLTAISVPDRGPWDLTPARVLYRLLRHARPHIVHTQDYKSDLLIALLRPQHHIATAHGFTDADWRQRLYRRLNLCVLRRLPAVIVPSSYQARILTRAGIPRARLHIIPPAPDWDDLERRAAIRLPAKATGDAGEGHVLTFAGRMSPEKGGHVLLSAFARVGMARADARLWFLGDGPSRRAWQARAQNSAPASRIRFWGWREDAPAFVRHSTFVVMPSLRETLGLIGVEAQGLGVPVIASRTGGLPETLLANSTVWVPPGRPEDLAEAILDALHRAEMWRKRAQALAFRARAAFSHSNSLLAHEALYRG